MTKSIAKGSSMQSINVSSLCRSCKMSRSNFYKKRELGNKFDIKIDVILNLVKEERKLQPRLGGRKLHYLLKQKMKDLGVYVGRDVFFNILRSSGLLVPKLPRTPKTTNSKHSLPVFQNLIKGKELSSPFEVWVSDITYISLSDDFVYLTLIMDLYSRMIVGYHCSKTLKAEGSCIALDMALSKIKSKQEINLIHHSDRGTQYCSHEYVNKLTNKNLKVSMTEVNHCAENSYAERLNGILKQEYGLGGTFRNKRLAEKAIDQAIYLYNYRRPHTKLKYKIPSEVQKEAA